MSNETKSPGIAPTVSEPQFEPREASAGLDIQQHLKRWATAFESTLAGLLKSPPVVPVRLAEAVRYVMQSGGKRVRPFIVTRICELSGGSAEQAAPAAVALECVHTFSLVHDDLPAMDNDDLRRGRPTCHKVFGEAVAILAGDALLTYAFELLAKQVKPADRAVAAVAELAAGTGWAGMIGGQTTDILSEGQEPELALVERIHRYKTARLFETAGRLGAICAGASADQQEAAARYGDQLGKAFQIADDLLDVLGDASKTGKAVAKDADAGKQTYPGAVGIEASRQAARQAMLQAVTALESFGPGAEDLRALARFVVERDR